MSSSAAPPRPNWRSTAWRRACSRSACRLNASCAAAPNSPHLRSPEIFPMRRRTFLASLPLAAASLPMARAQNAALPKFQAEGAGKFERPDVHAGDRPAGASFASRSAVYGQSGAAGTAHPLATLAAIETLKRGGSAVDAAIAANACLGFLEPTSSGLGGDCFAMIWDPKLNQLVSLAGSGRSPRALTLDIVRSRAKNNAIPPLGAVAVSVPGALDAWWTMHQ